MANDRNDSKTEKSKPYDLTEKASVRPGDEGATTVARRWENDDMNEERSTGGVNDSHGDERVENRISTSSSED